MVEVKLHDARFEVEDAFGEPVVVVGDAASGYRGTYRSDPRSDGRWTRERGDDVGDAILKEDLDIALGAARQKEGPMFFRSGDRYLLVPKGGQVVFGQCAGPYSGPSTGMLLRTDDGEVAVMYSAIRTAVADDRGVGFAKDKSIEAVRVRFSCGHSGGVWPEGATIGTAHRCLECGRDVTVTVALLSRG